MVAETSVAALKEKARSVGCHSHHPSSSKRMAAKSTSRFLYLCEKAIFPRAFPASSSWKMVAYGSTHPSQTGFTRDEYTGLL